MGKCKPGLVWIDVGVRNYNVLLLGFKVLLKIFLFLLQVVVAYMIELNCRYYQNTVECNDMMHNVINID